MSDNPLDKESDESFRAIGLVNTFLLDHSPVFKNLVEIKRRVSIDPTRLQFGH